MTIWQALQDCVKMGKVKHLGVSNFGRSHIEALVNDPRYINVKFFLSMPYQSIIVFCKCRCQIMPVLNQIEFNPYMVYEEIVSACRAYEITVQAYAPIGSGLRGQENVKLGKQALKTKRWEH